MKDYIVLDLETPNRYCNSMSSIGIVVVENNEIVDEIYSLINPEAHFDSFNINFTGISPSDVEDSPTFDDYWNEIEDLLCSNVIVGQNITFDLSVISRSLTRYGMSIPSFKYYCTLSSCRRNLNLSDNSLSYIVYNVLNKEYDAHNAMSDALMTNELYHYLSDYDTNRLDYVKLFSYKPKCKRDFDRKLDLNINYLYGLIQKFIYSDKISESHYNLIEKWYFDNKCYGDHPLFKNILLKLSYILMDNKFSKNNMNGLIDTVTIIQRSPLYKAPILKLEAFRGIIDSIICEDMISRDDVYFIDQWVDSKPINDKVFKKFYNELDVANYDNYKQQLRGFSKFLEQYVPDNAKK